METGSREEREEGEGKAGGRASSWRREQAAFPVFLRELRVTLLRGVWEIRGVSQRYGRTRRVPLRRVWWCSDRGDTRTRSVLRILPLRRETSFRKGSREEREAGEGRLRRSRACLQMPEHRQRTRVCIPPKRTRRWPGIAALLTRRRSSLT